MTNEDRYYRWMDSAEFRYGADLSKLESNLFAAWRQGKARSEYFSPGEVNLSGMVSPIDGMPLAWNSYAKKILQECFLAGYHAAATEEIFE